MSSPAAAAASAGVHALAGATGGMLAMTLLYPLDNIRARLQVQEHKRKDKPSSAEKPAAADEQRTNSSAATSSSAATTDEYVFRGSVDCLRYVVRELGWRNLYRGLKSAIVGMGVSSAVYFYWYQWFRTRALAYRGKRAIGPVDNVLVACLAGVVNVFLTTPFWVVNTRMTIQRAGPPEFAGLWDAFVKIAAENKFYGFYRGIVPSLILVSNPAIQFVTYEQLSRLVLRRTGARGLTAFQAFALGAVAKALATVATYPYQVVKSRLQAERGHHDGAPGTGFAAKVARMWRDEGWEAFFAGLNAKLSQTVATAALMFVLYEKILRVVQKLLALLATPPVAAAVTAAAV